MKTRKIMVTEDELYRQRDAEELMSEVERLGLILPLYQAVMENDRDFFVTKDLELTVLERRGDEFLLGLKVDDECLLPFSQKLEPEAVTELIVGNYICSAVEAAGTRGLIVTIHRNWETESMRRMHHMRVVSIQLFKLLGIDTLEKVGEILENCGSAILEKTSTEKGD